MVGSLSFVGLLLVAAATPAAAISIFSTSHSANTAFTCASGVNACGANDVFIVNPPLPAPPWTPTSPFNASAQWISYNPVTSQDTFGPANTSLAAPNVTINFALGVVSAPTLLTLHVWADDTATVRLNNGIGTLFAADPLATYSACASSGITCSGGGTLISFLVPANASAYQLSFDLFQRGGSGSPFGLMWDGDFGTAVVPEPATILLLGSALTAAGVASRRRWRKTS
jgi:hypothetical protein